jgi:hypothetical protein
MIHKKRERKRLPLPTRFDWWFQGYSGLLELIAHIIDIIEVLAQLLDPPPRLDHLNVHHIVPFIYMQLIELPELNVL